MSKARIYIPEKNAMQSGKAHDHCWLLEFVPEKPYFTDGLMGWTGMTDMKQEVKLFFPTPEAAAAYAEQQHIPYEVISPTPRAKVRKTYADNFRFDKVNR